MTCGCGTTTTDRRRTKEAMCWACLERRTHPGLGVGLCINGEPWDKTACPLDRHPDDRGIVKWAGRRWYGVPFPIRTALAIAHPKHPRPSSFDGCGCVKSWKDLVARIAGLITGRNRHGLHPS